MSTDRSVDTHRSAAPYLDVASEGGSQTGRFSGQVCLVTGGARGIGLRIAETFAHEGGYVGITARTESECDAAAKAIGHRAIAIPGDITDPKTCKAVVKMISQEFGFPNALVNAAGISPVRAPAEVHDGKAFEDIARVNLVGTYRITQAVAPGMLARQHGSILMVASALGLFASPRLAAYGASKAGVVHLARTLAREWAAHNVRVNALCPGYVETSMTKAVLERAHLRKEVLDDTPMGRLPTLDEIVAPGLFLLSDAASYVTGVALAVDGGMST